VGISETEQQQIGESEKTEHFASWMAVLSVDPKGLVVRHRRFLVYIAVNIFFTIYISQIHSTLPLYFKKFVIETIPLPK